MNNIFSKEGAEFPYSLRFPGQSSDEKILYVTREHKFFLYLRLFFVTVVSLSILLAVIFFANFFSKTFNAGIAGKVIPITILIMVLFVMIGFFWVYSLWQKSVAVLTTKRLMKFIYTTPVNRYNMSLPLDMIVDTSCNSRGFFQSFLKIGTLTARSSASSSGVATDDPSRINKKYFYLENIKYSEDLQQYLNKILGVLHRNPAGLADFRPFIPHLKGEARKKFLEENYPEYL
jgi:hypothetical protein